MKIVNDLMLCFNLNGQSICLDENVCYFLFVYV